MYKIIVNVRLERDAEKTVFALRFIGRARPPKILYSAEKIILSVVVTIALDAVCLSAKERVR